jgi:hypothetical protein
VVVTNPMDVVKTRLQVLAYTNPSSPATSAEAAPSPPQQQTTTSSQRPPIASSTRSYQKISIWATAKQLLREEGAVRGLVVCAVLRHVCRDPLKAHTHTAVIPHTRITRLASAEEGHHGAHDVDGPRVLPHDHHLRAGQAALRQTIAGGIRGMLRTFLRYLNSKRKLKNKLDNITTLSS